MVQWPRRFQNCGMTSKFTDSTASIITSTAPLIAGSPSGSSRRSQHFPQSWELLWPHVSTANAAHTWLLPDTPALIIGPGEISSEIRIAGSKSKGTSFLRLLDSVPPSAPAPGHVLWQEDWQLHGRGRSGPGRWTLLVLHPTEDGTHVDIVAGHVRHGRFQHLLKPVVELGQKAAALSALHQLGLLLDVHTSE